MCRRSGSTSPPPQKITSDSTLSLSSLSTVVSASPSPNEGGSNQNNQATRDPDRCKAKWHEWRAPRGQIKGPKGLQAVQEARAANSRDDTTTLDEIEELYAAKTPNDRGNNLHTTVHTSEKDGTDTRSIASSQWDQVTNVDENEYHRAAGYTNVDSGNARYVTHDEEPKRSWKDRMGGKSPKSKSESKS